MGALITDSEYMPYMRGKNKTTKIFAAGRYVKNVQLGSLADQPVYQDHTGLEYIWLCKLQ
jgi:hypothetical protein